MREPSLLIELHTLPSIQYMCALSLAAEVFLEAHEHYQKQTCRNRYHINTAHGKLRLTVPVDVPSGKTGIRDVRVETGMRWRNQHWRSIEAAYRKAPFFEHYANELRAILFQRSTIFLWDLNWALLSFCLTHLRLPVRLSETVSFEARPGPAILDARNLLHAANTSDEYLFGQSRPYYQVFGSTFVTHCSVIDLLFCMGPQAIHYISLSHKPTNK